MRPSLLHLSEIPTNSKPSVSKLEHDKEFISPLKDNTKAQIVLESATPSFAAGLGKATPVMMKLQEAFFAPKVLNLVASGSNCNFILEVSMQPFVQPFGTHIGDAVIIYYSHLNLQRHKKAIAYVSPLKGKANFQRGSIDRVLILVG